MAYALRLSFIALTIMLQNLKKKRFCISLLYVQKEPLCFAQSSVPLALEPAHVVSSSLTMSKEPACVRFAVASRSLAMPKEQLIIFHTSK
jgi:hypothetical protein